MTAEISTLNLARKTVPAFRAAILRYAGPHDAVGTAFSKLRAWVRENDASSGEPLSGYFFGRPNEPTEQLRVEVRAPLRPDAVVVPGDGVELVDIPETPVAYSIHRGDLSELPDVVDMLFGWMDLQSIKHRENDHIQVYKHTARDEEDHWVVEVQVPVLPKDDGAAQLG